MKKDLTDAYEKLQAKFPDDAYKHNVPMGGFKGTTIDPYHIIARLNNIFGMCGYGWGVKQVQHYLSDRMIDPKGREFVVINAHGVFWYCLEETDSSKHYGQFEVCGGTSVFTYQLEHGYKQAHTNLISKAASMIGVGISIYQGKGVDSPYNGQTEDEQKAGVQELVKELTNAVDKLETEEQFKNFWEDKKSDFLLLKNTKSNEYVKLVNHIKVRKNEALYGDGHEV